MFRQPVADLLDHVDNGRVVVVAGDANDDIRRVNLLDAFGQVRPKCGVVIHGIDLS